MALPDTHLLQYINIIADSLSCGEVGRLLYLCENLDADDSVSRLKDVLRSKVTGCEDGRLLLAELLLHLRRFDILRKVFSYSRAEVEETLKHREVLPRFRVLIANISEDMASEDLKSVKFLLGSTLPREKTEKAKNFLDVVTELEKLDKVSPERVELVEECLRHIDRIDLAKKVNMYKTSVVTSEQRSCQQQSYSFPLQSPTPNSTQSPQQTRLVQSRHIVQEKIPVPIYREKNYRSPLDWYKFNSDPRGVCVIIDCVGNDGEMLEHTFKALHFNVVLHKLLSVDDTLSTLRRIFRQRENHRGDGFVCCIISRGTASHLLATDSYGMGLRLDTVRQLFTADECPMLAGKPKLFFIQRYSIPEFQPYARMQHRDKDLETDGCDGLSRGNSVPTDADVFWSHCWTDERHLQQGHHRSIYLKALTDALHKGQRRKTSLIDAHLEVNRAIYEHNNGNPGEDYHIDLKHTLRKELHLQ
ncbi:CASP8 and FADD-like apoptosis regulator [Scomber scombrus]|uniref:CASP8 and FADD-like apoptosis regulator n=2 Tax=Scomber scombrus TaxID=13677 RepID=A0AAV1N433_SCOSC|nr:CASP8 and FADD-like apoptosis regulator [Scomber scombrus]